MNGVFVGRNVRLGSDCVLYPYVVVHDGTVMGDRVIVKWNTALAGPDPIRSYNIYGGEWLLASLPYRPQLTLAPMSLVLPAEWIGDAPVRVEASTALPPW